MEILFRVPERRYQKRVKRSWFFFLGILLGLAGSIYGALLPADTMLITLGSGILGLLLSLGFGVRAKSPRIRDVGSTIDSITLLN